MFSFQGSDFDCAFPHANINTCQYIPVYLKSIREPDHSTRDLANLVRYWMLFAGILGGNSNYFDSSDSCLTLDKPVQFSVIPLSTLCFQPGEVLNVNFLTSFSLCQIDDLICYYLCDLLLEIGDLATEMLIFYLANFLLLCIDLVLFASLNFTASAFFFKE